MKLSTSLFLVFLVAGIWADLPGLPQVIENKLPVPNDSEKSEAEKRVRQMFKARWNRKEPHEQLSLASDMIEKGVTSSEDPSLRFTLFLMARNIAVRANRCVLIPADRGNDIGFRPAVPTP